MNIIKGYIIPKRRGEEIIRSRVFADTESYELYAKYIDFLKKYIKIYMEITGKDKLKNSNDIKEFLNSLVFYIKSFTFLDIIPADILGEDKTLLPSSSSLLRSYLFVDPDLYKSDELYQIIHKIESLARHMNRLKEINNTLDEIREDIFEFPADTRPGYNTSSLLLHILTVSAIAVAIYRSTHAPNDYDLQILRLVSLFHDIGKMSEWHKHETISANILLELLEPFCEGEAREMIIRSADIISRKREDELYKIFKRADGFASSLDRVTMLLPKLMPEGWKKIEERAKTRGYSIEYINNWRFWDEFSTEEIEEFTKEFCINASEINGDNPVFDLETDVKTNEVIVSRIDFQGIQSYIYSNMIRVMNGASRIVDVITTVLIPFYLVKQKDLAAESILYYGGGNITLILPSQAAADLHRLIDECKKYFSRFNIQLNYGSSLLYNNFAQINTDIDNNITENKLLATKESPISVNIGKLCDSCGSREVRISDREDTQHNIKESLCHSCSIKFDVGNDYHFSKRIDILLKYPVNKKEKLLDKILEYIAGHAIQEIEDNKIKAYKNLAYMKIDGNLMGQFMASSISITDAYERSVRIDQSLKKALHDFLLKLAGLANRDSNWCNKEYIKRIVMGIMYMGGDDALILAPSTIALPLSLFIIDEYYLNMGKKSTLSIGVAIGKPKHPLQLLKEASEYLLDEITKDEVREYAYRIHSGVNIDFRGALAFWVADGSRLSKKTLDYITTYLNKKGISLQPYHVSDKNNERSVYRLLEIVRHIDNLDSDYISLLLNMLNDSKLELKEEYKHKLKELRRDMLSTLQVSINGESDLMINILFAIKEMQPSRNQVYRMLIDNLLRIENKRYIFPLYDLYQLLKVIGVE
ncbi:MAG: HD domain-containing protein [Candidatus Nitrosocaldaceae archaeon]